MKNPTPLMGDVGQRVSIRLRDGAGLRDILGTLESLTSVRKKDGSLEDFDPAEISAWRIVRPVSPRAGTGAPTSMRINEIEQSLENTWPAEEIMIRGGWRYRLSSGFTYRANSIIPFGKLPLGQPELPFFEEIQYAIKEFTARGLTPTFHLPLPAYAGLDQALEREGWQLILDAHILIADKADIPTPPLSDGFTFVVEDYPSDEWLGVQGDDVGKKIMSAYPAQYISISYQNRLIATGRVAESDDWAVLSRIYIKDEFRGTGLARPLLGELVKNSNSTKCALQVDISNSPAIELYSSSGFRAHHNYRYRSYTA
jgi:GNAT superfamily N-acetyltransferase